MIAIRDVLISIGNKRNAKERSKEINREMERVEWLFLRVT